MRERKYGLYIDYEWCTGCHSCEYACKQEHEFEPGQCGIRVVEVSYVKEGRRLIEYHPLLTEHCNFCVERVQSGKRPACVHHCQAACMEFGELERMVELLKKGKGTMWGYPQRVEK